MAFLGPHISIGRLPARNRKELKLMVKKLSQYEDNRFGARRKAVCVTANPAVGRMRIPLADKLIVALSKAELAQLGTSPWEITGTADIEAHPFHSCPWDFPESFRAAMLGNYDLLAYFGHSDKRTFYSGESEIPASVVWNSPEQSSVQGLFLSAGCMALADEESYGVQAFRSPGGPAAVLAPVGKSHAAFAALGGRTITNRLKNSAPSTVGEWWLELRKQFSSAPIDPFIFLGFDFFDGSGWKVPMAVQRREHLEMWLLYGDPAMAL